MIFFSSLLNLNSAFFEDRLELLPEEKRQWCSCVKNENARKETILAWLLLRHALNMKSDDVFLPLVFSDRGKPHFENCNIHFNLSHSGNIICAAVSRVGEIGVDVQKISKFSNKTRERVFCYNERSVGERQPNPDLYFTRLWSVKESYLKQTGTGIAFDLKTLDFSSESLDNYFEKGGLCYTVGKIDDCLFSVCTLEKGKQIVDFVPAESL